jgi:hypothetical protein
MTTDSRESAFRLAHKLATAAGVNVWLHLAGDDYEPLPEQ